jgi:hypothetical protein
MQSGRCRTLAKPASVLAALTAGLVWAQTGAGQPAQNAPDQQAILRYDLLDKKLVPISPEDLKPGCIYNHFSSRLNRRVWSFVQADGQFWHAFGEGTTQEAWRFDLPYTREEALEKLAQTDPKLERRIRGTQRRVFVELDGANQWGESKTASRPTIYDVEDGRRWEQAYGQYVRVTHIRGDRWAVKGGKYVPASLGQQAHP